MKLDSEKQRQMLVQVLDHVAPQLVQGADAKSVQQLVELGELRRTVAAAELEVVQSP